MSNTTFRLFYKGFIVDAPTSMSDENAEILSDQLSVAFEKLEEAAKNLIAEINPELVLTTYD